MTKYSLTYFNIEGGAEKIRLAFVLAGVPFEDVRLSYPEFGALKPSLPLGQVPVLRIDDGKYLPQSDRIVRYIGTKYNLNPEGLENQSKADEVIFTIVDINQAIAPSLYVTMNPAALGHEDRSEDERKAVQKKLREALVADGGSIPKKLQFLNDALAESTSGFVVGDKPTIADAYLLPVLRWLRSGSLDHFPTDIVDRYPALVAFEKAIYGVPSVRAHYKL